MIKKKGRKPGIKKEEQAAGGHPRKESSQKEESGPEPLAGPSQPKQQPKKHVEPSSRFGGGDITAGPFQPLQGQKEKWQPQSQFQAQQPYRKHAHFVVKKGRQQEGQAGVPLQTPSLGTQVWVQNRGRPEVTPPQKVIAHEIREPIPPRAELPRRITDVQGQQQHFVRPAGSAPGTGVTSGLPTYQKLSSEAPGGPEPRGGPAAPGQAQGSLPMPRGAVQKHTKAGVAAVATGGSSLLIPRRKGCGTQGRKIVVETNYLSLDLSRLQNKVAYHYDVEFKPALPKRLLRYAMEEFRLKYFPNQHPAFDGRKNLYTSHKLPEVSDVVKVHDEEFVKVRDFEVTVKYATEISMESLLSYMKRGTSVVPPQNAVQALDVVLRSARMSHGFMQVGRSFFTPPSGQVLSLGDGLEMWYGLFQSAVLGWKPFLNIDVAHKGFPKLQNVVDAIIEICGHPRNGNELAFPQKENFARFIRGLKVDYMLPNNPSSKRTYKVHNIAECPAKLWFELENNQPITIQDYFSHFKGVTLRQPYLPCLHVGSLTRKTPIHLPAELCRVSNCQVINKKMTERQTAAMIKNAATSTDIRKNKIMDVMRSVGFNEDPCVQEFGISVGDKFQEVEARILNAPLLDYGEKRYCSPDGGVWRPKNFLESRSLQSWVILNLDSHMRAETLWNFGKGMQQMGKDLGMEIGPPLSVQTLRVPTRGTSELESFFRSMKDRNVKLVIVVVPDKGNCYGLVKQVAELAIGVLTQCVKSTTVKYMKPATYSNILLKVNSKLDGVNHTLQFDLKPPCLKTPIMIVGADVTHPPPDQNDKPSVAAVCASHDPQAFKYNIQIRLQPPKVEIIQDMQAVMREHLLFYYRSTGQKPSRIIFYRDGVSEGQFLEVLKCEVGAIRRACTSLEQEYKPMVTFLVVQKRHHTRFFPKRKVDEHGKSHNVPPGTVVDTQITHPTELDFFLVSHASIQGVSRPTKYHLLWNDDDNMTTDELQQLTYYLCHMFSRCTRSVSYPAPTYNAHLAAYRAGVYLGERANVRLTNLEYEQKKYFGSEALKEIMKKSPMFFV